MTDNGTTAENVDAPQPDPALKKLEVLVGKWKTEGSTKGTPGAPAARIDAIDTYEWLPGQFALLHLIDAKVGDQAIEGAEVIGYDPARHTYITQYFGSDGPGAYEASLDDEEGSLVWRMRSKKERSTGSFSEHRNAITGHWESLDDNSTWQPWMDITLTKLAG